MESPDARERRALAVSAATEIAAAFGVHSYAPTVLKDSNNTVVHLAPSPVVAKVATSSLRGQHASNLAHELTVGLHLAAAGAPVVPPSSEIPPDVYRGHGLEVTFWRHCPGEVRDQIDRPELFATLEDFHAAFADYRGELKPFTDKYEECRALLDGERLSPELSEADRRLLRQVYEHLRAELGASDYECVPAHEEVHGGNVLWVGSKPLLIDFESCCRAPREIDYLACEKSLPHAPRLDRRLMRVLGLLKSFCVAVWCWAEPDRAPEVREAAEYHLGRLRRLTT